MSASLPEFANEDRFPKIKTDIKIIRTGMHFALSSLALTRVNNSNIPFFSYTGTGK